jgi:hypothetical protein
MGKTSGLERGALFLKTREIWRGGRRDNGARLD